MDEEEGKMAQNLKAEFHVGLGRIKRRYRNFGRLSKLQSSQIDHVALGVVELSLKEQLCHLRPMSTDEHCQFNLRDEVQIGISGLYVRLSADFDFDLVNGSVDDARRAVSIALNQACLAIHRMLIEVKRRQRPLPNHQLDAFIAFAVDAPLNQDDIFLASIGVSGFRQAVPA